MIETLSGIKETVNFDVKSGVKLYDNKKFETYPPHWHTPLEIVIVLENNYQVICNSVTYNLEEGDILFINSGVVHSMDIAVVGRRLFYQIDCSILHCLKELHPVFAIISPALYLKKKELDPIHEKIYSMLLKVLEEYISNNDFNESMIYSIILQVFVEIGRNYSQLNDTLHLEHAKHKIYTEKFFNICKYIDNNFFEQLTLEEVANLAGFSKFHFARLFKQFTGLTFYSYLVQKRISYAEKLLIDPNVTIIEVGLQSGFSNIQSFNRTFKLNKGCTPTEFRTKFSS